MIREAIDGISVIHDNLNNEADLNVGILTITDEGDKLVGTIQYDENIGWVWQAAL